MPQSEATPRGRQGPEMQGILQKKAETTGEWRPRYFELRGRRLYYYKEWQSRGGHDAVAPGTPIDGYRDIAGAVISEFEERGTGQCNGLTVEQLWYGIEIMEEYGVREPVPELHQPNLPPKAYNNNNVYSPGDKTRLVLPIAEGETARHERERWISVLRAASRPAWLEDSDPRGQVCMETGASFTLFNRRHHCRTCGGIFAAAALCKISPTSTELPELTHVLRDMGYTTAIKVCRPCASGAKFFSRWVEKEPIKKRVKKNLMDTTADNLRQSIKHLVGWGGSSPTSVPDVSRGRNERWRVRQEIEKIYELKAPHKLRDVDKLMQEFHGKEQQLLDNVVNKWGAVPLEDTRSGRLAKEWSESRR